MKRYGFDHYGDPDCPHAKEDRRDVKYMVVCGRCGAARVNGEWRVRK